MKDKEIEFARDLEIQELKSAMSFEGVNIIVGLRRSGKSYLLNELFFNELINMGFKKANIHKMDLSAEYDSIRTPNSLKEELNKLDLSIVKFVFVDEVQLAGKGYADILISFRKNNKNVKVYVTGSNSKILSEDVRKAFREDGNVIYIRPLSYKTIKKILPDYTCEDYLLNGSLPIVLKKSQKERQLLLQSLYEQTYISDIKEHAKTDFLSNEQKEKIVKRILSNITTPISENKIVGGILEKCGRDTETKLKLKKEIHDFIETASHSFLVLDFEDGKQYSEKTPEDYINHDIKKYCFDTGLLNVIWDANQQEKNASLLENAVYLELLALDIKSKGIYITKKDGNPGGIDFSFEFKEKKYLVQVVYSLSEKNKTREADNLLCKQGNYERILIYKTTEISTENIDNSIKLLTFEAFLNNGL